MIKKLDNNRMNEMISRILADQEIDLTTFGLYMKLYCMVEDFQPSIYNLAQVCPDGQNKIKRALKTLETKGYIRRTQVKKSGLYSNTIIEFIYFDDVIESLSGLEVMK